MTRPELRYLIFWEKIMKNVFLYGSKVEFLKEHVVRFENPLMASGVSIVRWNSLVDYQGERAEPGLPLLEEEKKYHLKPFYREEPGGSILLRVTYFNRFGDVISFEMIGGDEDVFSCPKGTHRYMVELVNGGNTCLTFHHLEIYEADPAEKDEAKPAENAEGPLYPRENMLLHKEEEDATLRILVKGPEGRMQRIPAICDLPDYKNLMVAPNEVMLPQPFFSDAWLRSLPVDSYGSVEFIPFDERSKKYTGRLEGFFLKKEKDAHAEGVNRKETVQKVQVKRRANGETKKLYKVLKRVNALAGEMRALSDEALSAQTQKLKALYKAGRSLDELLPEAYASIREAAGRVLGMYPYDVQVLGAIALHQGNIAEMVTGEGKTLVACMPLYLNALTEKSNILVTVNEYLAYRDGKQMTPLYQFMQMTLGIGVPENPSETIKISKKHAIYASDIVYTTNGALGFDYLIDNLAVSKKDKFLRDFYYCIIDEADSVLLDSAQTPLVISGAPRVQSNLHQVTDYFVSTLQQKKDYEVEDKNVWLTGRGIEKAERFFATEHLFSRENYDLIRNIVLALKAHAVYEKDKDYVVDDGEIKLLDVQTGRVLNGTKLRGGQHQALEAKENVKITMESRAMASITYQDFFNKFPKKAGMTGTGIYDIAEFKEIYGVGVVPIPTRNEIKRIDYPDRIFGNVEEQLYAALDEVMEIHATGQPVLLISESIAMTDIISELLLQAQVPHNVLNAYNIAKEAQVIAEAGEKNAVTIATSIAGRGTDIKLGEGVRELGGLALIGIGRMANTRIEMQARGRSGRQGDPGFSRFYVSLEDDIVLEHGPEKLDKYRKKEGEITSGKMLHVINNAQKVAEEQAREARRSTQEYGESIRNQRELIYQMRDRIIESPRMDLDYFRKVEEELIENFLNENGKEYSKNLILRFAMDNIAYRLDLYPEEEDLTDEASVKSYLMKLFERAYEKQMSLLEDEKTRNRFCELMMLKAIDEAWIEQVDFTQQLRGIISGRQYASRNPLFEFNKESYKAFQKMQKEVKIRMMRNILLGEISRGKDGALKVLVP